MPSQIKNLVTVIKVPKAAPTKDIIPNFPYFTKKDGNVVTSRLHLEMIEDSRKVKPGAPMNIQLKLPTDKPPSNENKGQSDDHGKPKHKDKHGKSKHKKSRDDEEGSDDIVQRDLEFLKKLKHKGHPERSQRSERESMLSESEVVEDENSKEDAGVAESTLSISISTPKKKHSRSSHSISLSHSRASRSERSRSERSRSEKYHRSSRSSRTERSSESRSERHSERSENDPPPQPQLSPEQERLLYLRKIEMWRKQYPMKPIPEFGELSDLNHMRQFVRDFEFNLSLDSSIWMYSTGLQYGFIGAEKLMVEKMNIDGMRGYAKYQTGLIETMYHPYIVEISQSSAFVTWFYALSPDMKLVITILFQTLIFYLKPGGKDVDPNDNQPRRMQGPSINLDDIV